MNKKKKRIIWGAVLLIAVIAAAVYFRPLSFEKLIVSDSALSIACTEMTVRDGKAVNDTSTRNIEPGTPEYDELKAILEKYSYHRNLKSFIEAKNIKTKATAYFFYISVVENDEKISIHLGDSKEIFVDWHSYDIGYFGDKKYTEFLEEFTEWYFNK